MPRVGVLSVGVLGGRLMDWGSCGFWFCVGVSLWGPLWVGGGSGVLDLLELSSPKYFPLIGVYCLGMEDWLNFGFPLGPFLACMDFPVVGP